MTKWMAEFGAEISDGKVKTSETEREWKMGKMLEMSETPESGKSEWEMGFGI